MKCTIMPTLKTSDLTLRLPKPEPPGSAGRSTSGAQYETESRPVPVREPELACTSPKSLSRTRGRRPSVWTCRRQLDGLMSRWMNPCECRWCRPDVMSRKKRRCHQTVCAGVLAGQPVETRL